MKKAQKNIIVALDFPDEKTTLAFVDLMDPTLCRLKIGKECFTAVGPQMVKALIDRGFDIFLDLKFHDIPNTVANACKAAADLGVWMLNVHALGGPKMLQAASQALASKVERPLLIAVTALTSMDDQELASVGLMPAQITVPKLAKLAQENGLDGVVCSAQEASLLRAHCGQDFLLVTPGIRVDSVNTDDQNRTMTPQAAIALGVDYLVIGRPITQSDHPYQSLLNIYQHIQG